MIMAGTAGTGKTLVINEMVRAVGLEKVQPACAYPCLCPWDRGTGAIIPNFSHSLIVK